jgi:drug/metabolite transporter (DMT)-like permease
LTDVRGLWNNARDGRIVSDAAERRRRREPRVRESGLQNRRETVRTALFIAGSVVCLVSGQLIIKFGLDRMHGFSLTGPDLAGKLFKLMTSPFIWLGLGVTAVSSLFWFDILSTRDPSYAYPYLSLTFVLMQFASRALFHESIPSLRWVGIVLICLGAFVISRT